MRGEPTRPTSTPTVTGRGSRASRGARTTAPYLGAVVASRLPDVGSTLQPTPATGVELVRHVPSPVSPGLLVAGTLALVGALRMRRSPGA
jgi:hypothetical protein